VSKASRIAVFVAVTALAFVASSGSTASTSGSAGAVAAAFGPHAVDGAPNAIASAASPAATSADLTLFTFDAPDPAGLGQSLDYNVFVDNLGPDTAAGVVVTDTLPSGVTFVSAEPTQGTCSDSSGVVTCSLGDISVESSASIQIRVTTPTSPATLTNTASVTSATPDPDETNNSATETTSVESGVDLSIAKGATRLTVHPGSNVTYGVVVSNQGPNPATGVEVTDTLPSGVTFVSATPTQGTCSQASGTVTCDVGALGVADEASIDIVVTTATTESRIVNSATVTGNETDPDLENNTTELEVDVVVSGAVISNGTVSLGVNRTGDLNYNCRAVGDPSCPAASAGGVNPVGLRFVPLNTDGTAPGCLCEGWGMADAVSGLTGYDNEAAGQANITVNSFVVDGTSRAVSDVTISDESIPGSQMRVVQDYHPSAASPNMYENTVTVTNTGTGPLTDLRYRRVMDWDVEPTAFREWSTIQGSSPQLLFDSDNGFASADPLDGPSYRQSQVKCGAGYTGPCTFTDLGSGGEYPTATTPADIGALFDFGFGSLPAGQSKTFRVFYGAAPDEAAALSAIGSVGAEVYSMGEPNCPGGGGTTGGCDTLPANAGVEQGKPNTFIFAFVTTTGDLSITKSDAPDPVLVNGDLTYTLTVRNNGPDPVTAVQVSDTLPAGVTHVSTTTTRGTCSGTATVGCNLGTVPNGATDTITIVVRPTTPGPLSNTATVSSPSADVNLGNNTSTTSTTVNPVADLRMAKSDSPDPVLAGQELTYTLTVTNDGPNAAVGVQIVDPLPAGVTFVSASAGCTEASGTVTCTIGALANGANAERTIVVRPTVANSTLSNTATASATTADPNTGNNSVTATTVVNPAADLALTKTDTPDPVLVGSDLTYTLTVTNNGPSGAAGVSISDPLPAGVTFVSAGTGCTEASGTVTCTIGNLANGANEVRTIVVRPTVANPALTNTAAASATTVDPVPGNNSATATTVVNAAADLSLSKTDAPDPVLVGSNLTYMLTVTNDGPSDAAGVSISDPLPAGVTFVSASTGCSEASGTVTCTIGNLANGANTSRTIVVTPTVANPSLSNTATATATTADPNAGNNSATASTDVDPAADLSLSKTDAPDPVLVGNELTYTLTVTNNGPSDASGVSISDSLPAGVSFVSAGAGCAEASGTVTCAVGDLANGANTSRTITVTPTVANPTLTNTATASATTADPAPGNNSATATTTVNAVPVASADLSLTKTDSPDPVTVGNDLTYTLTVTNNGPDAAAGVTISDTLPSGVTFVSATGCTHASGTVTCAVGDLGNGASATRTIVVTPTAANPSLSNTAAVTATTGDPNTANNSATETTTVTAVPAASADLALMKTDAPDPVLVGSNLAYTLTVTNNGPDGATGVTISDPLPAGVTFVSAGAGCTEASGTVTCAIGDLANGSSASRTITVTPTVANPTLSNTATASATTADPVPANNSATATTDVDPVADLALTKTDAPDPVLVGNDLTYTLTVTNNGPSDATGATISDPLPADVTFVSAATGCTNASGTVTCAIGALANGANTSRTITVTPTVADAALTNTATASAATHDPNTGNNSATAVTDVDPAADLSVTKAGAPDPVLVGGELTYTLTVANAGPSDSTGVTITDPLPSGVSFVSASAGCTNDSGTVTCAIGDLANGANAIRTITVRPTVANPTLSNTAQVTASTGDPNTVNNSATATTDVDPVADLALTKTDSPDPVLAGANLTYTLTVTNNGPLDATGVTITDTLPGGVSFVSAGTGCTNDSGTVTCAIGALANVASASRTIVVTPTAANPALTNTATASAATHDPNTANNSDTAVTDVNPAADLSLTKTDAPDPVPVGNELTYTLTVTNSGPSDASGVTISDPLPAGVGFVSAGTGCTEASGTVTCTMGDLANGASASRTITVTPAVANPALTNTAAASATTGDPNLANNTASATTRVNQAPNAVADSITTNEDTPGGVNVLANDVDPGDTLIITANTNGANGSVSCAGAICTYTPTANFNGTDSFTYTVSDTGGLTSTATVNVTVNPVNDPPNAVDDSLTTDQGVAGSVNVLANDNDIDGGALSIVGSTNGGGGTVTCSGSSCTYTPNAGFSGSDSFTYTIGDGLGGTATATVAVTVRPVVVPPANRPPNCSGVTATPSILWPANGRFRVVTLAGATDPDGNPLTFRITSVTQDEAVEKGPDAQTTDRPNQILLRADRRGRDDDDDRRGSSGNGRVYRIAYTVSDGTLSCSGVETVGVPRRNGQAPVDSGGSFNSFATRRGIPVVPPVTLTDFFNAVGQFKVHSIPIGANIETVEIKIKWKRKGDRFVVRKVKIYSGRKVIARGPSMVVQRRPKKLRISTKGTPTSSTVRISNLAPGKLKFNVTADKLRISGRTSVTTQIRRIPK
jgi:uncharacterized repeat protein (TIGR01451 family)